jgi:hypothetical protein
MDLPGKQVICPHEDVCPDSLLRYGFKDIEDEEQFGGVTAEA